MKSERGRIEPVHRREGDGRAVRIEMDEARNHVLTRCGYSPNRKEDRALDVEFLKNLKDKNPRKVIHWEKVWVHREDLHPQLLRESGCLRRFRSLNRTRMAVSN